MIPKSTLGCCDATVEHTLGRKPSPRMQPQSTPTVHELQSGSGGNILGVDLDRQGRFENVEGEVEAVESKERRQCQLL